MTARILVVNDTQEILELFRMILEGEGYEVILSGFPMQQIQDVEEINPDLIILDFVFGDQKVGWQMLQMLKMKRSTEIIPIIVCTAALDMVREQEGYLHFLAIKPELAYTRLNRFLFSIEKRVRFLHTQSLHFSSIHKLH